MNIVQLFICQLLHVLCLIFMCLMTLAFDLLTSESPEEI